MPTSLLQAYSSRVDWPDALALAAATLGESPTLLALERERVLIGQLDGDARPIGPTGAQELQEPWQLRIFSLLGELRWGSAPGLPPRAALLMEGEPPAALPEHWRATTTRARPHEVRYLLWGQEAPGAPEGWIRLTAARIGQLQVPLEAPGTGRVQLLAREYHGTTAEDSLNTVVLAERWCVLAPEEPS